MKSPPSDHRLPLAVAPAVGGAAALVVVAIGASARAHLSLPLSRSPIGKHLGDVGALAFGALGLIVVLLILLVGGKLLRYRKRKPAEYERIVEFQHSKLAQLTAIVFALAILVVPAVLLLLTRQHKVRPGVVESTVVPPAASTLPPTSVRTTSNATATSAMLIAGVILLCLVIGFLLSRRRRRVLEMFREPDSKEPDELLQVAAISGSAAMRDVDDPRSAIIACYTAMQRSLEAAGVDRRSSDSPTELLARAAQARVAPGAGRKLTALFLEARFSAHAMSAAQRRDAVDALAELASLAGVS